MTSALPPGRQASTTRSVTSGSAAVRVREMGAWGVAKAYRGELAAPSEKSWDVRAAGGALLQVKCRVVGRFGAGVERPSPFCRTLRREALAIAVLAGTPTSA
jgi:hypothetical protein